MFEFPGLQGIKCHYVPLFETRCKIKDANGVQEASSSNLDTRTIKTEREFSLSVLIFSDEIRRSNAARMSAAADGWTEANIYDRQDPGDHVNESRHSDQDG